MKKLILPILLAISALSHAEPAKYITIGDPAPPLKPAKWLKGKPITSFEKGKFYVVEFWATWCNPCKENIPHLTELAKKYKDQVSIIGVSIWESVKEGETDPMKKVADFVKQQGSAMDYIVAADGPKNVIADDWMKAASEGGIPCSFIINGEGKIAWIGHPAKMEETLKKVLDGTYDVAAARTKREFELNFTRPIDEAMAAKDYAKAVKAIDRALEKRPELEYTLTYPRLVALYHTDLPKGIELSKKILTESNRAIGAYQMMASIFATQPKLSKEAYEFGIGLIDEAITLNQGVHMFTAMKAEAYFHLGDKAKAIQLGEEAVKLAEKEPHASKEQLALLTKNLAKYKAAK